jgi:hypothetical protein
MIPVTPPRPNSLIPSSPGIRALFFHNHTVSAGAAVGMMKKVRRNFPNSMGRNPGKELDFFP